MKQFMIEAPIVLDSPDAIAAALENIANLIRAGHELGMLPGEIQCMVWQVEDAEDDDAEEPLFGGEQTKGDEA